VEHHDEDQKRETINSSLIVYNNPSNGQKSGSANKVKYGAKNISKGTDQDPLKQSM